VGEACSRNVGDVRQVKPGSWRVRVTNTKGRRARDVPIPATVVAMLNLDRPADTALFVYPTTGERVQRDPFRNRVVQPAARRAGLSELHVHDLRHTAASMMIAGGADVKKVQEALGHKSATMTLDLYGHLWETGLDDVAVRVDAMLTGAGGSTNSLPDSPD
ncbi:MAG: tyrosine-type recombinase/integrase, partial [Propionicimonas sp.]|nr:tyrosine-type recombinase/integrase [Propionicimonas sp.]